jgi:hypothetical protein
MLILSMGDPMRFQLRRAAYVFGFLIFIQSLGAQARTAPAAYPELAPLPLSEQLSALREPLPVDTIIDAALQFSGATDPDAAASRERLAALMAKFRSEVADVTSSAELAERALAFLHRNLFTSYSFLQTRVDTALQSGVYNCVSSAVLYLIVARSVGLSVSGVRTTDHAFCTVLVNGQQVDVETTNPLGYNPGSKKEFTDSFGKVTGFSYVPPGSYSDRRPIGEKELLSLILVNRVSEDLEERAFRDALRPAVSAYTLVGSEDARQVMKVAFSDFVSWMGIRRDFAQGIQFIDAVKASFGGSVDLEQPRRDLYHNWVVSALEAGTYADADALLAQPGARATLGDADWTDLSVGSVERRAAADSATNGNASAAAVVADGLKRLGRQAALLQNFEAYAHNAFAQLYNAKKFTEARAVVDQGLVTYPDSRLLQQDLDLVKKQSRS